MCESSGLSSNDLSIADITKAGVKQPEQAQINKKKVRTINVRTAMQLYRHKKDTTRALSGF